jgi:hypothetical protein
MERGTTEEVPALEPDAARLGWPGLAKHLGKALEVWFSHV